MVLLPSLVAGWSWFLGLLKSSKVAVIRISSFFAVIYNISRERNATKFRTSMSIRANCRLGRDLRLRSAGPKYGLQGA